MFMMTDTQQDDGIVIGTGEKGSAIVLEGDPVILFPNHIKKAVNTIN